MTLSCACDFDEDGWWYEAPDDFSVFPQGRRKRCCSCHKLIDAGTQCVEFPRVRYAATDIEERIYGDTVVLASWYMCEWCGEMYFNLEALGYCHWLGDSIKENLEEYWELTGFDPRTPSLRGKE